MFRPWNVNVPKVRVGENRDGGYVLLNDVFGAKCMIGYGVDINVTFDNDFVNKFNIPAYIFDHTITEVPALNDKITFTREGIGAKDDAPLFTLETHVKRHVPDGEQFVLKMDVEGAEWDVFRTADLSRVTQLIAELHDIHKAPLEVLNKINEQFYLVHIHANNYPKQPYFNIDRIRRVPVVLECTWVRKDLVKNASLSDEKYPTELDFKNDIETPDLEITFWDPIKRPISFIVGDKIQEELIKNIMTPDDEIISHGDAPRHSRIFNLKEGDHVSYQIIATLDTLYTNGTYMFPIVNNGIATYEPRFINGMGPTFQLNAPIFNFKKYCI
jgi:hypothetical protein